MTPLDEAPLQQALARLVDAELLYQRGVPPQATYLFKHALIQETAYQSLLKSTRQQFHQRIAQVLEARFPASVETQPELVAQHYTAAGCVEQAVVYWQRAGQHASDRSAHLEAISHLTTGIELLTTLPETPEHTQQALTMYIALGAALLVTKGQAAPEVEHAYTQARALCQQVGETPELFPILFGLFRYYVAQPQLHTARDLGEILLRLAQRADDPALAVIAHHALGATWCYLGVLPVARQHLEEAIARYTPDQRSVPMFRMGQDPGVACRINGARTLWLLGYSAQAVVRLHDALALAHELSHPYSLASAQQGAALISQLRRDVPTVHEHAEAAVALATEQDFPLWAATGTSLRGWALAMQGQGEEGLTQIRRGIAAWRATGAAGTVPYLCTLLAEVSNHLGRPRRRSPGTGRGPRPGGATRGTLVGSGSLSPTGCLTPAPAGDTAGGGRNLVAAGPGRRPPPGGEIAGTARRHEPGTPVAAAGQARRGLRPARTDLWLVHRGFRHRGPAGGQGTPRCAGWIAWPCGPDPNASAG